MKIIKLMEAGCEVALMSLGKSLGLINIPKSFDDLPIEIQADLFDIAEKRVLECSIDDNKLNFLENILCWFLIEDEIRIFDYLELMEQSRNNDLEVAILADKMIEQVSFPQLIKGI